MIPKYLNNLTEGLYQSTTYLSGAFRRGRNIGLGIASAAILGLTVACGDSEIPPTPDINATVEARVQATVAATTTSSPTPTPERSPTSSQIDYSLAEWIPADSSNYLPANRNRDDINQIVIHTTEATTLESTINWFKNPGSDVSSHYLIGPKGKIIQMVREKDVAWHARDYNTSSIGIEHVGKTNDPNWATEEMYKASAELVRYLAEKYGIPIDKAHIQGHDELYPKSDPGQFWDWDNYMSLVGDESPVANGDGRGLEKLTDAGGSSPTWSPDGKKIAFVSYKDGNNDIYVMNADGSGIERLTDAGGRSPTWSPDGKKIAFVSLLDVNLEIYVMNADGSDQERLTNNPARDKEPAWSPDGKKIAFVSNRDGNQDIYVMNADGRGIERLTYNRASEEEPAWSPDGKKIAFVSDRDRNREDIYVMNADGRGLERLTYDLGRSPTWSPDGKKIAFMSHRDDGVRGEIYVMNADGDRRGFEIIDGDGDGSGFERLTSERARDEFPNDGADNEFPTWSPDGKKIAFVSDRDWNDEIYVMNVD